MHPPEGIPERLSGRQPEGPSYPVVRALYLGEISSSEAEEREEPHGTRETAREARGNRPFLVDWPEPLGVAQLTMGTDGTREILPVRMREAYEAYKEAIMQYARCSREVVAHYTSLFPNPDDTWETIWEFGGNRNLLAEQPEAPGVARLIMGTDRAREVLPEHVCQAYQEAAAHYARCLQEVVKYYTERFADSDEVRETTLEPRENLLADQLGHPGVAHLTMGLDRTGEILPAHVSETYKEAVVQYAGHFREVIEHYARPFLASGKIPEKPAEPRQDIEHLLATQPGHRLAVELIMETDSARKVLPAEMLEMYEQFVKDYHELFPKSERTQEEARKPMRDLKYLPFFEDWTRHRGDAQLLLDNPRIKETLPANMLQAYEKVVGKYEELFNNQAYLSTDGRPTGLDLTSLRAANKVVRVWYEKFQTSMNYEKFQASMNQVKEAITVLRRQIDFWLPRSSRLSEYQEAIQKAQQVSMTYARGLELYTRWLELYATTAGKANAIPEGDPEDPQLPDRWEEVHHNLAIQQFTLELTGMTRKDFFALPQYLASEVRRRIQSQIANKMQRIAAKSGWDAVVAKIAVVLEQAPTMSSRLLLFTVDFNEQPALAPKLVDLVRNEKIPEGSRGRILLILRDIRNREIAPQLADVLANSDLSSPTFPIHILRNIRMLQNISVVETLNQIRNHPQTTHLLRYFIEETLQEWRDKGLLTVI